MNNNKVIYFNDDLFDHSQAQDQPQAQPQVEVNQANQVHEVQVVGGAAHEGSTKAMNDTQVVVTEPVQTPVPPQEAKEEVVTPTQADQQGVSAVVSTIVSPPTPPPTTSREEREEMIEEDGSECSSDDESCESISTEKLLSLDPLYIRLTKFLYTSKSEKSRNITEVLEGIEEKMDRLITIMEQKM